MRNLLDKLLYLSEDRTLNPGTITKYSARFDKFISMIKTGMPFYTTDKEPVVAHPSEAKRFIDMNKAGLFKGQIKLKLKDGSEIPLSQLLKTSDLGGQASTGQEGEETGKESALLKPSQIGLGDKEIPAENLGQIIISNPTLNSTEYGRIVVEMAKTIMEGSNPIIPKDVPETIRKSIVDYAGEYLGILALISGTSRFPRRKGFEEWLGGDISSLVINFPSKPNINIADSFATIKNAQTEHTVNISSKGQGGGAAPSLSGLKIPDELRKNKKYRAVIDFIELCDSNKPSKQGFPSPRSISQIFEAMNLLHEYAPDSLPKKFNKVLPWEPEIVNDVLQSMKAFKTKGRGELPRYRKLWDEFDFKKQSSDGGKLVYAVKLAVMKAINEGNALPEFPSVVLTILDNNFLQQYTDFTPKTRVVSFATQWPAKLDGKISLESKAGATDPTKGGFSFKLSPTEGKTKLDEPNELGLSDKSDAQASSEVPLSKVADIITKGHSKPISMKPKSKQGIGRKKRK
jgi:hypothetical protein